MMNDFMLTFTNQLFRFPAKHLCGCRVNKGRYTLTIDTVPESATATQVPAG